MIDNLDRSQLAPDQPVCPFPCPGRGYCSTCGCRDRWGTYAVWECTTDRTENTIKETQNEDQN